MTYREALKRFRSGPLAYVKQAEAESGTGPDYPGRRLAFVEFVDQLHRNGAITDRQAQEWDHPRENYAPKRVNGFANWETNEARNWMLNSENDDNRRIRLAERHQADPAKLARELRRQWRAGFFDNSGIPRADWPLIQWAELAADAIEDLQERAEHQ